VQCGTLENANLCTAMRLGIMCKIRTLVDALELIVPAKEWPLATYSELLFDDMADCKSPPMNGLS
jgi:glutamine synthetase type III